jgi:hypothetical protein
VNTSKRSIHPPAVDGIKITKTMMWVSLKTVEYKLLNRTPIKQEYQLNSEFSNAYICCLTIALWT